jgi:hypothetical protein
MFEEIGDGDLSLLLAKYKTSPAIEIEGGKGMTLITGTQEIKDLKEYLWGIAGEDVYLFKSFLIKKDFAGGERIVIEAWGLPRIVPWPDSLAFRLL